jgi:hypothetical protein
MMSHLPIHELILTRLKELGTRRSGLARRCGFKNLEKGMRRLAAVCAGDLESTSAAMVIKALPAALEVSEDVVAVAVRETAASHDERRRLAAAEADAAWRGSFKPHAYLCGTEARPSSITMYCVTGGPDQWLNIPLDGSQPAVTFAAQALGVVRRTPTVPFFGPTTGFIVNYTPDHAVRFGLEGNPVEDFSRAHIPGQVEFGIRR